LFSSSPAGYLFQLVAACFFSVLISAKCRRLVTGEERWLKNRSDPNSLPDKPDLGETFADAIGSWYSTAARCGSGSWCRGSTPQAGRSPSGRAVPACRLVLTTAAAVELIRTCGQVTVALTQAGVLRQSDGKEKPAAGSS
jgi:hypothetical protein